MDQQPAPEQTNTANVHKPVAKILMGSMSNRRLYCYFSLLILFIFIILALSFHLVRQANDKNQQVEFSLAEKSFSNNIRKDEDSSMGLGGMLVIDTNSTDQNYTDQLSQLGAGLQTNQPIGGDHLPPPTPPPPLFPGVSGGGGGGQSTNNNNTSQIVNCTQFALQNNITLADKDFQCPESFRPNRCRVCPQLCIHQQMNCDKKKLHCPDGQDEEECQDTSGAYDNMIKTMFQAATSMNVSTAIFKPESCSHVDFFQEKCPCTLNDTKVVFCEHRGYTYIPVNEIAPTVIKIKFSNNSIGNLDHVDWPRSLSTLVLNRNSIERLGAETFKLAPSLKLLFLSENQISYFDLDALAGLSRLTWLQLEYNKLDTFYSRSLIHAPSLNKLYLGDNMIDLPDETNFGECCQNLTQLLLENNRITRIRAHWFSHMKSLMWLSLSHNEISYIEHYSFEGNYKLEELNLSFNKIKVIDSRMFAYGLRVERLALSYNEFRSLPEDTFRHLQHVKSLNLTGIEFDHIGKETFVNLRLKFIYFEKFRYCHFASHATVCLPLTDGLSSNEELLIFPILKYAVMIVASVCCFGNVLVFVWHSVSPHEHYTLSLFVRNLSIADLMMGLYLAAIGLKDQEKLGPGGMLNWMSSGYCTTIGFIAILSSELSSFIIIIITIERYRAITTTKILLEQEQKRRARIYLTIAWVSSVLIASYPVLERNFIRLFIQAPRDNYSDYYYATNGLCLPLHIDQPYLSGWFYSAVVYLGINFIAMIIIILLYVLMYARIMQAKQQACPYGVRKREDAILATRIFFIVMTDCACWTPIVVIKILALSKVSIPSSFYGWLVVFIIPINAALNPIIYTIAAPTSLRSSMCKWFKRVYNQLAMGSSGSRYSSHSSSTSSGESATFANMMDVMGFRRKNTGSTNSTTVDTFDTSIMPSRPSVESALINYDSTESANGTKRTLLKAAPISTTIDLNKPKTNHQHQLLDESDEEDAGVELEVGRRRNRKNKPPRQQHLQYRPVRDLGDAVKPVNLVASGSSNLECSESTNQSGNKQQLPLGKPANMNSLTATNQLDSLNHRRRQYANTVVVAAVTPPTSSRSSSSGGTNSANDTTTTTNSDCTENKLNNNQADYLSTYENNTTVGGGGVGAPKLAVLDKITVAASPTASGSSQDDMEDMSPEKQQVQQHRNHQHQYQRQYRRRLPACRFAAKPNNGHDSVVHSQHNQHHHHVVVVQARGYGNGTSGLMKSLDPLQSRRSTLDSSQSSSSSSSPPLAAAAAAVAVAAAHYNQGNLSRRRFTEFMQVNETVLDDVTSAGNSLASLDSRLDSCQQTNHADRSTCTTTTNDSGRVSFSSKDSQTCLLSGAEKL